MKRKLLLVLAVAVSLLLLVLLAALLVFWVPDIPRQTLVEKYGGPESRFVELPSGARVHYRDQGVADGPVLLLIHGSNASLHTWEPWVELLGDELRVISLDLPGHGLTGEVPGDDYSGAGMARVVDELRQELGIERWSLAGNSMGGGVAWRYALGRPERVEALILVDSVGPRPPTPEGEEEERGGALAFRLAATPGINRVLAAITPRSLLESTLHRAIHDDSLVTDDMVDRYWELLRHPGNRRATLQRFGSRGEGEVPDLSTLEIPTLVMSGEEDLLVPAAVAEHLHELLPDSRLVLYPEVGHVPMEEIPERSAGDVREFLVEVGVLAGSEMGPGPEGEGRSDRDADGAEAPEG